MTTQPEQNIAALVDRLLAPWASVNVAAIVEAFAPDGVLHSMMGTPIRGRESIAKILTKHLAHLESVEFEILSIARSGDVIFTERVDHLATAQGVVSLPIVGVIYLHGDGQIAEWREYYDHAQAKTPPRPRAEPVHASAD